jgi:hypothetical protein
MAKRKLAPGLGRLDEMKIDPLYDQARDLMEQLTKFFNVAFQRKTAGGIEFLGEIIRALRDGYGPEELRVAYWVARCLTGKASWLSGALRGDLLPSIVLRHDGGINPKTGKPAVRWLDDMLARRMEVSHAMVQALYDNLPDDLKESEKEIVPLMGVKLNV